MKITLYWRNKNKTIFSLFLFHLSWLFAYKLILLDVESNYKIIVVLGQVYATFAAGIITGYPFYLLTYEFPRLRDRILFNPTLEYYVEKVETAKETILWYLGYKPTDYEIVFHLNENELKESLKGKLEEQVDGTIEQLDIDRESSVESILNGLSDIFNQLTYQSSEHFKFFDKYLTIGIIEILKKIESRNINMFNTTKGVKLWEEQFRIGEAEDPEYSIGLIALELASAFMEFDELIRKVKDEVRLYE
ncbi:hypothetical protein [uncultured Draconibacterium sp.]|uniref:hypothetical protein n=1 Tax=uncultured Draconibacterium sp. TaxID=1573823 RepID=UPI0025F51679|nr:hypothetical protein [uncultured Draconibacterium sp.]